jgi:hypothetical protein
LKSIERQILLDEMQTTRVSPVITHKLRDFWSRNAEVKWTAKHSNRYETELLAVAIEVDKMLNNCGESSDAATVTDGNLQPPTGLSVSSQKDPSENPTAQSQSITRIADAFGLSRAQRLHITRPDDFSGRDNGPFRSFGDKARSWAERHAQGPSTSELPSAPLSMGEAYFSNNHQIKSQVVVHLTLEGRG